MSESDAPVTPRQPVRRGIGFGPFESVTFGIVLLVLLFIYCTVGSAGAFYPTQLNVFSADSWEYAQIRTFRGLEMTEYEWFNWWPFDLLILLICLNITVVTLKRIRLNAVNLGVWTIHAGVLLLCAGSVWYFSTKVEGDTPVVRRQVRISLPDGGQGSLPVVPGSSTQVVGRDGASWGFEISDVNLAYTMLSGPDAGQTRYSVMVNVQPPGRDGFLRQLILGHPENTEDVVRSDDAQQPMARAIKVLGKPLVDDALELELDYLPQTHFYLANWVEKSWALYLRERRPDGAVTPWSMRPIEGMPLFNDYVSDPDEVWLAPGEVAPVDPLDVLVPSVDPGDPLQGVPIHVRSYLRYAFDEQRRTAGGDELDPVVTLVIDDGRGQVEDYEIEAFRHPDEPLALDFIDFVWAPSLEARDELVTPRTPRLRFRVPGVEGVYEHTVRALSVQDRELPFERVPGSDYEYRVEFVQDLGSMGELCSVELRTPERAFRRWVFDPAHHGSTVDVSVETAEDDHEHGPGEEHDHGPSLVPREHYPLDEGIDVWFEPGHAPAPVLLLAGPGDGDLGIALDIGSPQDGEYVPLRLGERVSLGGDLTIMAKSLLTRSRREVRPLLVPLRHRNKDAREQRSMAHLDFEVGGRKHEPWVRFHEYVFDRADDPRVPFSAALRRFPFMPSTVALADGRIIELLLSRERMPLPDPVVLDDFVLTSHVGGFSGRTTSILNWTSHLRFEDAGGAWGDVVPVTVNGPAEHAGYWYFQSAWDPPDPPSRRGEANSQGLNYTVLGVGNRHGVGVQLAGCAIAVLGMLYAFYVKPQILRKRLTGASAAKGPAAPRGGRIPVASMGGLSEGGS